ncbi:hypothetical protein KPH14_011467 [Odynerus spinipes]|uniref:CD80-like immunoglobulin C2-set domain-containing protein n=1 Tax=Odynerus spinipes TaxID=1348599 RepID=A0AAD9VTL8_9HYME|nr:hypothetical protein KPH14_011467 [Odynerus spinipes]
MPRSLAYWKKIVFLYIVQLFSHATCSVHVQLIAPRYVKFRSTATLYCNHSVPDNELYKIEFIKDDEKIFQYIKERNPPFVTPRFGGAEMEYSKNGTTIKLKDVGFGASGTYSCAVSTSTPIYTKPSDNVQMKVIVPQTENPKITFEKNVYVIGENLEANCSSSAALPVPHLTWFINGKELYQLSGKEEMTTRAARFSPVLYERVSSTLEDRHRDRENTALVNAPLYADSTADHPRCLRLRLGPSIKRLIDVVMFNKKDTFTLSTLYIALQWDTLRESLCTGIISKYHACQRVIVYKHHGHKETFDMH